MNKLILILILLLVAKNFGQDSLFYYPSARDIEITVNANVIKSDSSFIYNFEAVSGSNSIQNIFDFFIEFNSDLDSIQNPANWMGRVSSIWSNILMWSSRDSLYDISPGNSLSGYSYLSSGLPGINMYYGVGRFEIPVFDAGEAPDASAIVNGGILENSVTGYTIGAINPPDPFVPLNFLDTLQNYVSQSYALGWIINETTANKYTNLFTTAKDQIIQGDSSAASSTLAYVLQEADIDSSANLTSEAYALIRYNTEYLLENLPEVIAPVLNSLSPSLGFPSGLFAWYDMVTTTVTGELFTDSSVVYFNGTAKTTTYISDSSLTFPLLSFDIRTAGNYPVWVSNYGANSDTIYFSAVDTLPQPVIPVLNCVRDNGDRTFTAFFGYNNQNNVGVYIVVGDENKFSYPSQSYRGQPKVFFPGIQTNIFSVDFDGDDLTWNLNGTSVKVNKKSTPCQDGNKQ